MRRRHDEAQVRKAYFRLAQKYHPDKNPDGRVSIRDKSLILSSSARALC